MIVLWRKQIGWYGGEVRRELSFMVSFEKIKHKLWSEEKEKRKEEIERARERRGEGGRKEKNKEEGKKGKKKRKKHSRQVKITISLYTIHCLPGYSLYHFSSMCCMILFYITAKFNFLMIWFKFLIFFFWSFLFKFANRIICAYLGKGVFSWVFWTL